MNFLFNFLIVSFLSILLTHAQPVKTVVLQQVKDHSFSLKPGEGLGGFQLVLDKQGNAENVVINIYKNKMYCMYDFNTKKRIWNTQPISWRNLKPTYWSYISPDSIFVQYNAHDIKNYAYSDSINQLVDSSGRILNVYGFGDAPLASDLQPAEPHSSVGFVAGANLPTSKHPYFTYAISLYGFMPGDSGFNAHRLPVGGHIDIRNKEAIAYHKNKFPPISEGVRLENQAHKPVLGSLTEENAIFGFTFTPSIINYHLASGNSSVHRFGSVLADSVSLTPITTTSGQESKNSQVAYNWIAYNPYRKEYWRCISLPQPLSSAGNPIGEPKRVLVIADSNFRVKGEVRLPNYHRFAPQFDATGAYFAHEEATNAAPNSYVISQYSYSFIQTSLKKYKKTFELDAPIEVNGALALAREFDLLSKRDTTRILLIPIEQSCQPCMEALLRYIEKNSTILQNKHLHILLSAGSEMYIKNLLKEKGINLLDYPYLHLVNSSVCQQLYGNVVNPRYLMIHKKKVFLEETLDPNRLHMIHTWFGTTPSKKP